MSKILSKEPDRAGPICGYQISSDHGMFCGEPKAPGLYFCREHHDWVALDEENCVPRMAPGNAVGLPNPAQDPEYPYSPMQERRVLLSADAFERGYGRAYAEDLQSRDNFDPSTFRYYGYFRHGSPALRIIPRTSGEGAIYTPEYLARREGNARGAESDYWWAAL